MGLLEMSEVKRWLEAIEPGDRLVAIALVNSLRIIPTQSLLLELEKSVQSVSKAAGGPIALFVAREMGAGEPYFVGKGRQPIIVRGDREEIGSEGKLAYLVTQLNRSSADHYLNHPSLETIAQRRCRHLAILDDISASGHRIIEFLDGWMMSKTMRSWWSYGRLSIHVVVYGITATAEARIRDNLYSSRCTRQASKLSFVYTRRPTSSRDLWEPELTAKVEDLCRKYREAAGVNPFSVLGYGDSMGNLIFSHGCPDNLPGILWSTENGWPAIFPARSVPASFKTGTEHVGDLHGVPNLLKLMGAEKVGVGQLFHRLSPLGRRVLLVLAALRAKAGRHEDRLLEMTGLTRAECEETMAFARSNGLVDAQALLTDRGRGELRHAERCGSLPLEPPAATDAFYYPRTLREARD